MIEDRRLRPPEEHEITIDALVKARVFETKQSAMTFAAALGWYRNSKRQISKAGEGVRWQVFERNQDSAFIFALAIAAEKSINALDLDATNGNIVEDVFEQFAAAGLDNLADSLANVQGDVLDTLLLLLAEARRENDDKPTGLKGLSQGTLDALGL